MNRLTEDYDPRRVLVIDDQGPILRTHARVLEAHGFLPILVPDASDALVEAIRHPPAVVVTDLVMPGMSGLELARRIRAEFAERSPGILLASAFALDLTPTEQLAFDSIFAKPYLVDRFVQEVRRLVRETRKRRQHQAEQRRPIDLYDEASDGDESRELDPL